jgi:hypothetical protein
MGKHLKLLTGKYLDKYSELISIDWYSVFNNMRSKNNYSTEDFQHYIQVSATWSSNIEGNSIDVATYLKNKKFNIKHKQKETSEIDALVDSYNFAMKKNFVIEKAGLQLR